MFLEEAAANAVRTLLCGDIFEGSWSKLNKRVEGKNGQKLWDLIEK